MDINEKIAANRGLVLKQLHRFNMISNPDAESYAYEALYKAIENYDESRGYCFSTFATCVIANALRMYLRTVNKKKQITTVSFYTPVYEDDNKVTCLVDILEGTGDAEAAYLDKEACNIIMKAFVKHKNNLSENHRAVIDLWYNSYPKMSQMEIADAVHLSQPVVSRVIAAFKHKLRKELEEIL